MALIKPFLMYRCTQKGLKLWTVVIHSTNKLFALRKLHFLIDTNNSIMHYNIFDSLKKIIKYLGLQMKIGLCIIIEKA